MFFNISQKHVSWACVLALAEVAIMGLTPTDAQTQTREVIAACYVPRTGQVYRIGERDLPSRCRSETDVAFRFNVQGPPGAPGPQGPSLIQGYAFVKFNGGLRADKSFNVTSVSLGTDGKGGTAPSFYCFELPFTPNGAVASGVVGRGTFIEVDIAPGVTDAFGIVCPSSAEAIAQVFRASGTQAPTGNDFFIVFW